MVFPDALDKPSRTIITGEGGRPHLDSSMLSNSTHKEDAEALDLDSDEVQHVRREPG